MTTWKQFVDEMEREAQEEGQEAIEELEAFRQYCGRNIKIPLLHETKIGQEWSRNEQPCLIDLFFKHQKTLPEHQRTNAAMISCPCARCNPARL